MYGADFFSFLDGNKYSTLLTYTYMQIKNVSENVIVKLQQGSVSAADRRLILCFIVSNWHNSITMRNNNVAVDDKNSIHVCYPTIL